MPLISIIVPVYNTEQYIKRCINSILSQTLSDFELLLIDDGSTDCSGAICDEFAMQDKRIRVFHQKNSGVSSSRNVGLAQATGEWIYQCDSDDWLALDALQLMYEKAVESLSDMVICDFVMICPDSDIRIKATDWNEDKATSLQHYIGSTWTCMWMILGKRSLYTAYNLQSPTDISYCEDFHLAVRLAYYANKVSTVHQPLYFYNRLNDNSIISSMNRGEKICKTQNDEISVYQDIINFFKLHKDYPIYEKVMSWRILKAKQVWVLRKETWNIFLALIPESRKYIWSCPFINRKIKIMCWCLTHHLSWITNTIIYLRQVLGR